jgi:hypothetical protein
LTEKTACVIIELHKMIRIFRFKFPIIRKDEVTDENICTKNQSRTKKERTDADGNGKSAGGFTADGSGL